MCTSSIKRMVSDAFKLFNHAFEALFKLDRGTWCPRQANRHPVAATRLRSRGLGVFRLRQCAGPGLQRWRFLPTPGSPMRAGLFLRRRLKTWITRSISISRPTTGSSFPVSARLGQIGGKLIQPAAYCPCARVCSAAESCAFCADCTRGSLAGPCSSGGGPPPG